MMYEKIMIMKGEIAMHRQYLTDSIYKATHELYDDELYGNDEKAAALYTEVLELFDECFMDPDEYDAELTNDRYKGGIE